MEEKKKALLAAPSNVSSPTQNSDGEGDESKRTKDLVALKEQELEAAKRMPGTTTIEIAARNKKVEAIQKEIDTLWNKLSADGGETSQCGWLRDRFGLSWQIVPDALQKYIGGKDRGFRFQPSEFMKIILAVSLAKYLHDDPKLPTGPGGGGRAPGQPPAGPDPFWR